MKKFIIILSTISFTSSLFAQQILFFDDFEGYNNGDTVVNLSNFQGWGANGSGVAINDPGNGAGGSDQYFSSTDGYMALQIIDTLIPGETYRYSMNGALTAWNQNGIKFQIIQLNGPGNTDDVIKVDFTLGSVGSGQQNVFKLIDTLYTTTLSDTGNFAFRFAKNWGPSYKIDNFKIECTTCPPPLNPYNVTLKVNTSNITVGSNGMYAGGGFLGGSDALQLSDIDGDGTWEGVASVLPGTGPNYYAFFNSPNGDSDWGTKEDLSGQPCGVSSNFNDRVLPTISSDTIIQHCFGSCESDGTCPTASVANINDIDFSLFPNPAQNKVVVNYIKTIYRLELTDITGKVLFKEFNIDNPYTIDLTSFPSNIYFLSLFTKNGVVSKKLVVNKIH
tara:strand:+ start:3523 stop:4692 length:1170 start_codon:yes stop_codon:yes gene_type:complete